MFKRIFVLVLTAVMALGVFAGCRERFPESESIKFTVTYSMKGHIVQEQTVRMGETPAPVDPQIQGLTFQYWVDENGQQVDPTTVRVLEDLRFEAVAYPDLSQHMPFLFMDENGLLRPDDPLTNDDLYNALHALATPGAEDYFPGLYTGSAQVTAQELKAVMGYFFPAQQVEEAFAQELTRSAFAQGMLKLLNRSWEEKQIIDQEALIPKDLNTAREDVYQMLESAVAHTPDMSGITWSGCELPAPYDPGFVLEEGVLYYVKEDGYYLKDGNMGQLYFDANGCYTSGDAELDKLVTDLLKQFAEENPDADRFALLRVAYDHCVHDGYKYLRKSAIEMGATGWEIECAKSMIQSKKGNCYDFAAAFWALARGLGYEAYAISGTCTDDFDSHGWVQIEIDGEDYFFDPEWHYAYITEGRPRDMFMISMDDIWFWNYIWKPIEKQ